MSGFDVTGPAKKVFKTEEETGWAAADVRRVEENGYSAGRADGRLGDYNPTAPDNVEYMRGYRAGWRQGCCDAEDAS